MTGTLINVTAIIVGGTLGLFLGRRLSDNLKSTLIAGMGLFTTAIGFQMFLKTENPLVVLGAIIIGAILGEWWKIEERTQALGIWLEKLTMGSSGGASSHFVRGFLSASVLFCTGPMAVLGSISDGLRGDTLTLSIKSILDGIISIAFASTLGMGVAFSAIPVLAYQGGISLVASQLDAIISATMMKELTATGGILLMGVGISSILEIKMIRVGNFLPAIVIAPLIVYILSLVIR
ncbi:MAG: hypothetical protein A2029_12675 [Chloroflexi bacterium RBG_19FT_COMBO_47_9]|nr:MAG: hypothetical protein A2029_12675 [Chloroflexi bacterium RBG_19FT_COMBO_47_9]